MPDPLDIFHPQIADWFRARVGTPTDIQARAWPEIAEGRHILAAAPTGTGKTLTAFLWAIQQLVSGAWPPGLVRILYVSPLKALNNDIRRNLLGPLAELRDMFTAAGEAFPEIQVQTRSGDTESRVRQAMVRRPPEILITTPESLNLILSAPKARLMLRGVQTVILDEIHAVAGTKRGAHLMTAVERVVPLAGEFQRIALSATVNPLYVVAGFVGGFEAIADGAATHYRKRSVHTIQSSASKTYALTVRTPSGHSLRNVEGARWPIYADALRRVIAQHRTTLVFANNRRLCERLAMLINEGQDEPVVYAHHGSLSREMREVVEQRLKHGELAGIVATSSLELGIDIGDLDEVVLVQTPPSIASTVQRIGRAGHRVGEVSRASLFPTHGKDFVYAAAMTRAVLDHDVEPLRPVVNPLDVLAQVILSMCSVETWNLDALYTFIRTCYTFYDLPRPQFDAVAGMLAGRYNHARVRSLDPVVSIDAIDNTIRAIGGARNRLYLSGGTIPDRGYYNLRVADSHAKIGELDEEFVWERRLGESFTLGTQSWKIQQITHNDVLVTPVKGRPLMVPFWKADDMLRHSHASLRLARFLREADARLDDPAFRAALIRDYGFDEMAADELLHYLDEQRAATGVALPHVEHVVVEINVDLNKSDATTQMIVHTLWGGALNKPWAFALAQAWEQRYGKPLEVSADNDSVVLVLPRDATAPDVFALAGPDELEALLRRHLERTGFFGARFRESAARALLLPKQSFQRREPLWWNRQRAQALLGAVREYEDFPILTETWRTCIHDEFELDVLRDRLHAVRAGAIAVSVVHTATPSPFCESMVWQQTNTYMYMDDTPASKQASALRDDVLKELVFRDDLRPRIPRALAERFRVKLQRVYEDYAPRNADELLDWVKERQWIPMAEWEELLAAMARDQGQELKALCADLCENLGTKLVAVHGAGVLAREHVPFFQSAMGAALPAQTLAGEALDAPPPKGPGDARDVWLAQWLRFYGPLPLDAVRAKLPIDHDALDRSIEELLESQTLVVGTLVEDARGAEICDAENFEIMLRMLRAGARPEFEILDASWLPLFLAHRQHLESPGTGEAGVQRALEPVLGYAMPAGMWEAEVFPARVRDYRKAQLDAVMQASELRWIGAGEKQVMFAFDSQLDLLRMESCSEAGWARAATVLPGAIGRFTFADLLTHTAQSSADLTRDLWDLTWRGCVANDAMETLRSGIATKFRSPLLGNATSGSRRRGFTKWKSTRPFAGHWYRLPRPEPPRDLLDEEELQRDRVRLVLDRYGVLFREVLNQETSALRWGPLFRTMRLMELAGELVAGHFFHGIAGLQFMATEAFTMLAHGLDEDVVYMINATDPASLCGVNVHGLKDALPARVPSTHLVYHGRLVVITLRRSGREWTIHVPETHGDLPRYLEVVSRLVTRDFQPMPSIAVERVNAESAPRSPYVGALRAHFDVDVEPKRVTLWKKA